MSAWRSGALTRRAAVAATVAALTVAGCARAGTEGPRPAPAPGGNVRPIPQGVPLTRAERTNYAETSTYDDVVAFLDSLQARGAQMHRGTLGTSTQGRAIPYVIASRPLVRTPAEAHALDRPIVYVQGNIHGGEVEGKEVLQMLLRDLLLPRGPNLLDSLVLIAVPIYNVDGNEQWGPQEEQRSQQQGPARVGLRPNAQQLDLNRDYIKAEAPETRGALALLAAWDPHVFVDLHTTNGSYHGYALTYAPSLHPSAPLAEYTRRFLLDDVRRRLAERYDFPTFEYGNFSGGSSPTDTVKQGWFTYDHRPRFGTNYYGLRNRIAVLSEAYSHDPFARRIASTYAFTRELLAIITERGEPLLSVVRAQDVTGGTMALEAGRTLGVALRSRLVPSVPLQDVIAEDVVRTGDSTRTEAGVPPGLRRTGRYRTVRIPVHTSFETTYAWDVPAGFVLAPSDTVAVRLLRLHGIAVGQLTKPWTGEVYAFLVDSVSTAERPFQGHREARLEGERWTNRRRELPAGSFVVAGDQKLGRLALVLLDPLSDDGLVTWNFFDDRLKVGAEFPVLQIRQVLPAPLRPVE